MYVYIYISYGTYIKSMRKKKITTRKRKIYESRDSACSQNMICKLLIIAISPSWKACINKTQHAANMFFTIKTNKQTKQKF